MVQETVRILSLLNSVLLRKSPKEGEKELACCIGLCWESRFALLLTKVHYIAPKKEIRVLLYQTCSFSESMIVDFQAFTPAMGHSVSREYTYV